MPLDTTQIDQQIDANITTSPPRGITALKVRTILKAITAFVKYAIDNNLSVWRKMGGGVSGTTNDNIYHLGKIAVGRADEGGTQAQFSVHDPATFRQVFAVKPGYTFIGSVNTDGQNPANPINEAGAAQLSFGANTISGSSDLAMIHSNFSGGGFSFWQQVGFGSKNLLGWLNANGSLLLSNTIMSAAEKLHVQGNAYIAGLIRFPASVSSRRIVLYALADNDDQFFGFGINGGQLRYQVGSVSDAHVFYAGSSPVTSAELMRIIGTGAILMGTSTNNGVDRLQVNGSIAQGWRSSATNPTTATVAAGTSVLHKNTANGELRLWANDGGVMKSILLMS